MKLEGNVESITSKEIAFKKGGSGYVYTMRVQGSDVDMGFNKPYYSEGEYVSLDVQKNRWNKLEIVKNGATGAPAPATQTSPPKPSEVPISRELAIIRQNALTNAVNYVTQTSVPSDTTVEDIINVAYQFAEFSSGQREVRIAKEKMEHGED